MGGRNNGACVRLTREGVANASGGDAPDECASKPDVFNNALDNALQCAPHIVVQHDA